MTPDRRYGAEVVRRMRELTGAGDLASTRPGGFSGRADAADGGARVLLVLRAVDGAIVEARFRAYGCPYFIAAASWLTERVVGFTRPALESWDWREAVAALAIPPARFGRLITLQDAVRAAAAAWTEDAGSGV